MWGIWGSDYSIPYSIYLRGTLGLRGTKFDAIRTPIQLLLAPTHVLFTDR